MVSSSVGKPFYFQPPWIILFQLHKLQKVQPWDVNISFLLTSFLDEMDKQGEVDFRASGMALDSSANIYLQKSRLFLELGDSPNPPKPKPSLPPPIFYPLRYELTSTTIKHLLEALDKALEGESLVSSKRRLKPVYTPPPEPFPQIKLYLIEIEKEMRDLFLFLQKLANEEKLISFSLVIARMKKTEAIKTFITLLFLAQKDKVVLWQEEELGEIFITLSEERALIVKKGEAII